MRKSSLLILCGLLTFSPLIAQQYETKPEGDFFARYTLLKAPATTQPLLKKGDRLAIIGDSITEQKMYSRIMETYLTVCTPELEITARQYGWSGERAPGFLARMTNDVLRFDPTIATTCYGMNDHEYKPYEDRIGDTYRDFQTRIVRSFKAHDVRVVLGSPGPVGKMPSWVKSASGTVADLNENLSKLRNIDIEIATSEKVAFADVFWPMLKASDEAQRRFGADYAVPGKDGVHPDWAGQTIMAYAFLKGLGVTGDIGTYTVDLGANQATVSTGHKLVNFKDGTLEIKSTRYPFCATGELDKDNSIRSAMTLVPFNQDLNRLMLVVKNPTAKKYQVTWGDQSKSFTAEQLTAGVNLADQFVTNPFSAAFDKVDKAVLAKQNYETRQIKMLFHGEEGRADMKATVALTEKVRKPLAEGIRKAYAPVTHTLKLQPES